MKTAFITGVTGHDGPTSQSSCRARVTTSTDSYGGPHRWLVPEIDHLYQHERMTLHHGDLTDAVSLGTLVHAMRPDELYTSVR